MQYENQLIEGIEVVVEGNVTNPGFQEKLVRSRIKVRENDRFSQAEFDQDLKVLTQEFDRIEPWIESTNGKMKISLHVWPKPVIRAIHWEGNSKVNSKDLQKEMGITIGSIFDRQEFLLAFRKIKAYYVKKGFFEAQLNYDIEIDEKTNEIEIQICVTEGRAGNIKDIVFRGFCGDEEEELLEMINTKKYNFFMSWFTDEGTYHEEAVQMDQFLILNYLQNKGYADAEVVMEVCEAKQSHRIIVFITATRGERYTLGGLTFEGNTLFTDEEIRSKFCVCEGDAYSPEKIRETMDSISNLYGRRGYIESFVNFVPKLEEYGCVYSVHFTIEEGEQYRVGLIKVFGNCSTQTNVILHETLLVPGEVFNLERLRHTEERLRNMGYFKNVNVYAVRTEEAPSCLEGNYRDVHVEVEETRTGNFGAFFGFSTVESIFGGLNITESNFNYKGLGSFWREGAGALRGGGEYLHFTGSVGQKSRKYIASWTKPHFMDTPWSVGCDLERSNNRYISKDYQINAWGFNVRATYDVNAFVRIAWHYRIRDSKVDVDSDAPPSLRRQAKHSGSISATGLTVGYDSTDSIVRPTEGFRSRVESEFAGLGGNYTFLSLGYINTYYIPVGTRNVIKLRADARFIQPMGNTQGDSLPLDERFYLGGENEIRGFRPYRLGPQFNEGDPKGGISMQLLSAEFQRRLWKKLDGFVFVDAGHLSLAHWDFGRLYTSAGFGARFQVFDSGPPLSIGMGFPINAKDRSDVKKFFLNIGGKF